MGIAGLLALATPAAAEVPAPSLAAWHGTWIGGGTAFGKAAIATLVIKPAPDSDATALACRLCGGSDLPRRCQGPGARQLD
ncbi:MAG: hypothetical protein CVT78_11755 [Alphaproteobacteria bacterium HGW-Alphaproteobacteria-17]|nr:MAG: hypothetical protein CVT78_11755 [Alphaproteobacteria bacterium HGW-Alphaproteobacteria-17]